MTTELTHFNKEKVYMFYNTKSHHTSHKRQKSSRLEFKALYFYLFSTVILWTNPRCVLKVTLWVKYLPHISHLNCGVVPHSYFRCLFRHFLYLYLRPQLFGQMNISMPLTITQWSLRMNISAQKYKMKN